MCDFLFALDDSAETMEEVCKRFMDCFPELKRSVCVVKELALRVEDSGEMEADEVFMQALRAALD